MGYRRKVTEEDIRHKGLPFECDNCGNKPTLDDVAEHHAVCSICGDTIIAYTADTAKDIARLKAENAQLRRDWQIQNDGIADQLSRLRRALNDAIRQPMGVVPDSAVDFYEAEPAGLCDCQVEEAKEDESNICVGCGGILWRGGLDASDDLE